MNSDSNPETRRATAPEGAPMEKNIRDELKSPPPEATMEARREQIARVILRLAFQETERGIDAAMAGNLWPAERAREAADAILALFPDHKAVLAARGVYVASRASVLARGAMWRKLRSEGAPIISTWIDEDGENDTADLDELWTRIRREVVSACALILYVEADDFPLKGAFVEVGMALAANVPIFIVAPGVEIRDRNCRPFGSWIRHPSVTFAASVDEAIRRAASVFALGGGKI